MSLSVAGLDVVFGDGRQALKRVSLRVLEGEQVAVIGPSGAGKTTLLRVAGAALRPAQGQLEVLGRDPWRMTAAELRRLRAQLGMVHQSPPIPPRLRVVTAVLAGRLGQWSALRALRSLLVPADVGGACEALARVDMAGRLFDRCDRLSGGQLQRVGIARVLYQQPRLLLADESVSALDPALADSALEQLVVQSRQTGAALFASLHAVDLALKWFPRIVGMRDGEVVFDLPSSQVTRPMLLQLYASEGRVLPTQAEEPPLPPDVVPKGVGKVVPLVRPRC
ncbi:MAG TPA: ATP-binding cassette domain-containing protein [Burkholderiaceae bacterium]|nr:ATP-binding cassette domain-containing protein [Burkholderiaceae bacterium]